MKINTKLKCQCSSLCPSHENCIDVPAGHGFTLPLPPLKMVVWHGLGNLPTIEDLPESQIAAINNFEVMEMDVSAE